MTWPASSLCDSVVSIYIHIVVIYVCLFVCLLVCPIITREPFNRFSSNFDWELGRTMGMFLAWFKILSWLVWLLLGKYISKTKLGFQAIVQSKILKNQDSIQRGQFSFHPTCIKQPKACYVVKTANTLYLQAYDTFCYFYSYIKKYFIRTLVCCFV